MFYTKGSHFELLSDWSNFHMLLSTNNNAKQEKILETRLTHVWMFGLTLVWLWQLLKGGTFLVIGSMFGVVSKAYMWLRYVVLNIVDENRTSYSLTLRTENKSLKNIFKVMKEGYTKK